jgi:hypothetical protein
MRIFSFYFLQYEIYDEAERLRVRVCVFVFVGWLLSRYKPELQAIHPSIIER